MHPASKITSKYLALCFLFALLLLLPFKDFIANVLVLFSDQRLPTFSQNSKIIENLEKNNLLLSLELKKFNLLEDENNKLKKALDFKTEKSIDAVGADIISFDPSSWRRVVLINAGKNRGLKEGMYAIDHNGYLVGRIISVKNNYSRLMLVDDPEFNLAVFIGNDALGMLAGGLDSLKILYIDHSDKVNLKDIVWFKMPLASYPLYIGRVTKINENKENLFFEVEVKPFSASTLLNKIFIIK